MKNPYYRQVEQKLTRAETEAKNNELLAAYASETDPVRKQEVADELAELNFRLIVYIARKFENTKFSFDELISAASYGFIKALRSFKLEKGVKFASYSTRCMENEICMTLRKNKRDAMHAHGTMHLEEVIAQDTSDGNQLQLIEVLSSGEVTGKEFEDSEMIRLAIEQLPKVLSKQEYAVVIAALTEEKQAVTAEKLGISQSYVSRLERKALKKVARLGKILLEEKYTYRDYILPKPQLTKEEKEEKKRIEKEMAKLKGKHHGMLRNIIVYLMTKYPDITLEQLQRITKASRVTLKNYRSNFRNGKLANIPPEPIHVPEHIIIEEDLVEARNPLEETVSLVAASIEKDWE